MFTHVMLGANDLDASRRFYDATLGALGAKPGRADDKGRVVWSRNGAMFMLTRPLDGQPACPANGGTVGFGADSPEQADAWHAAGVAAGGTSVEDPPGWRDGAFGRVYLGYLRDPAGNKLCIAHRPAA